MRTLAILPLPALLLAQPLFAQEAAPRPARAEVARIDLPKGLEPAATSAEARAVADAMRIMRHDDGPDGVHAVIALAPDITAQVRAALAGGGPLEGRTVLVKDNIETRELPTTAGSLALKDSWTRRDAPLIANLRAAGGVVMGKTNLSEWANIRDGNSTSGWSAIGGLTRNPHAIDRNSCGSSSGSGAAVAAGFAWAAIGTETDGSITCPASVNGVVGFKPTVGLVSRTHVVPISHSQDTAGPMARSVADAAQLLNAIAGSDPADPATVDAERYKTDFTARLDTSSLAGTRIGVLTQQIGDRADVQALFARAQSDLEAAGAVLVPIDYAFVDEMGSAEFTVLLYELRTDMADYLASLPGEGLPRTLADIVAFNRAHADRELRWFGQATFERALKTTDADEYRKARETSLRLAGEEGIDKLLADNDVAFLIAPTTGPAWSTDLIHGDHYDGSIGAGSLAAVAGYPHLTVPMGAVEDLPVGLSFMGPKWSDAKVLAAGAAYERARTAVLAEPSFERWSPSPGGSD